MSVSSIDPKMNQVASLNPAMGKTCAAPGAGATGDDGTGASASLSPLAQVLGQLQQLQLTNPGELKTVLTDIADKLQAAAQQEGGSQGQVLNDLASKFQQAAQTGDLSQIRPHHHHGHHHHGAAAYQQQSDPSQVAGASQGASSATDVRSQVLDIIEQVMTQDLGTSATTTG
jgi:hypothetical protein